MICCLQHLPLWIYAPSCDMGKSFNALCGLVQNHLEKDPVGDGAFIFFNRRRDKMKILVYERHGFWLLYKRLEAGRFQLPAVEHGQKEIHISLDTLHCIIEGIDLSSIVKRKRFMSAA